MKISKLNEDRSGNIDVSPFVVAVYPLAALQDFTYLYLRHIFIFSKLSNSFKHVYNTF